MPAGAYPAGTGPAGAAPVQSPSELPRPLSQAAAKIDGRSKDHLEDGEGRLERVHPVDQAAAIAWLTRRGSIKHSPTTGHDFFELRPGDPALQNKALNRARQATPADRLIAAGKIEIVAVRAESDAVNGSVRVAVEYFNLAADPDRKQRRTVRDD